MYIISSFISSSSISIHTFVKSFPFKFPFAILFHPHITHLPSIQLPRAYSRLCKIHIFGTCCSRRSTTTHLYDEHQRYNPEPKDRLRRRSLFTFNYPPYDGIVSVYLKRGRAMKRALACA